MAAGIVENGNNGLFENEIEFRGKFCDYLKFLVSRNLKLDEKLGIFNTNREAYLVCALIGILYDRKIENADISIDNNTKIFGTDLSSKRADLTFIYRIIMLNQEINEATIDNYKASAFKSDDTPKGQEIRKRNMALFNAYACGGIEYLYEKFSTCEDLTEMTKNLYDLVQDFYEKIHGEYADLPNVLETSF